MAGSGHGKIPPPLRGVPGAWIMLHYSPDFAHFQQFAHLLSPCLSCCFRYRENPPHAIAGAVRTTGRNEHIAMPSFFANAVAFAANMAGS